QPKVHQVAQEEDQKNDESAVWNELLKKEGGPSSHVYLKIIPGCHSIIQQMRKAGGWLLRSAVFPSNNMDTDTMVAVARLLIAEGENLVTVPEHVLKAIQRAFPDPSDLQWVTQCFVRTVLHKTEIGNLSKDDKLALLEYVLSDGEYEELHGLQLLPLSDGSFRSFTKEVEDTALIDNEEFSRTLLPFCKERFLPDDLNSNTVYHLRHMATINPDLYRIINLDAKNVATFAREHYPRDWKESQGHVTWNYAKDGHPPKTWLPEFWKFLNAYWKELNKFIGMPLIPLQPLANTGSSTLLARLEKNSTLIFQSSRESTLPDPIQKVVKMVGGTVIKRDECLKHHDIEDYVLTASPKNVLQVLLNSDSDKVVTGFASASLHEREEFKTYMSSLDCVSEAEKHLLSALPLFRLMSGKYVAVESRQGVIIKSNPAIPTDLPVPEAIVQCANEADRRLLTLLKVELLDAAQLAIHLVDCIERKAFRKEEEQKIMTWILDHGNVLLSQSEELLQKSRNLSFIETDQGERKQASSVFDPTNKNFQDLFEEDFFPPPVYRTQVILQSLKQLGLRTREEEISSGEVLHVASQIQKLQINSLNKAFKKADALVRVLNRNDLLSNVSEGERRELLQMQWVPCETPNSKNSKSSQKRGLYKPAEIRSSKYSAIVEHVMPLTSELSDRVCQKLDLFVPPPAEKVLENLCVLGSVTRVLVNPDSHYEFKNKVHSTYKFMQENIEYFREEMNKKCIAWLWCQNEFVSPRDVVLVYPDELDLSFYIKKVPEEFLQYADMLKEFGIKETLSDEEIEDIFHDLKQTIDDREPPYGEPSELKLSIAILDWMRKNEKPLKDSTPVPVRAQNQNFTLEPLKNTVFCDISDEGLEDLRQDEEEFHVIHEEVLGVTAKWLKVPFLSTRILKPQFIITEEEYLGIEQCGQTEPITQRIKNILKEYDEVRDIFKELIQNAEDAGASTCGFLVDLRTHPPDSLIDDGMALCNGPCLWAYNNELFSEEDWKNIVRVGSASKENKIEKIGNFGLGFNAVYHLTDIPSILSGKSLLILDPNVTHLKKHIRSKGNPGIKLDLFQDRLFKRFPGQFRSYQGIFDCDLTKSSQNYYKGTLIKLPFRTSEEARRSEISCKVYDKENINAFRQHFTHDTQSPLLFLKNINSVSLQIVSEGASTPPPETQIQTLLKISKDIVCSMKISNEMHLQDTRNALENLDSNYHKIVDCFTAQIAEIVHEHFEGNHTQYWLLYSCLGTKDSLRMFQREIQECKFSLPIGGVAVPLRKQGENVWSPDESCAVGQAFCFLPLPIETGLPVHINGSFAVTSNRKALWQTGIKLEWNKALLQDANASAYITTLLKLKKMAQDGNLQNYDYYKFWPDVEKVRKPFQPLVCAFYSAITQCTTDRSLELFSNGQTWCSMDKARFLDPKIRNSAVGDLALKVFLNHTESGYCTVPLPSWVRNSLIQCGFREMVTKRTFHWVKFYQVVFKNMQNMDSHCRNALILNAIDLNDPAVDELLKSTPCIPAQKTGKLQFISKLVNPRGKVACLYAPEEGRFLDGTKNDFFNPRRIQRLSGLGMLSDTLPLEDVVQRAQTISRVWTEDEKRAQKCLQCLFDCMRDHLGDVCSPHWETLKHISFLPAVITSQDNDVMIRLKQPSEVYNKRYYDLVNMTEFSVDHSKLHIQPNDPVLTILGVYKAPPVETVLRQLKEAHDRSDALEKSVLLNMAKSCYDYLNKYLIDGRDPTAIIEHAHSVPFVLIEGHFVNVRSVAKSERFEEKPYLYVLPAIFSKFENLWNCVGMKNQFTAEQFVAALEEISAVSGPLSQLNLHTCLSIVTRGLYEAKIKLKDCLLPDEKGVLTHSSKFGEAQLLSLVKLLVKLRQNSGYEDYQDTVAAAMRGIRFIRDIHGCLQMASYYFDEGVSLYKVMLPKERFVPKAFWELFQTRSAGAKSLLKELGLKHTVSAEEIIAFAHQIESDARGNTDLKILKHRSSTLFKTVLTKSTEKKSKLMDRIATIKFIFPVQIESELGDFHKAFAKGRDVVAIKGSLLERDPRHQYLIWTAMPILPTKDCSTTHLDALKCGGALQKPPSKQVMQNLKNICRSPCNSDILVGTRAAVFSTSYAYLQSVNFDASVLDDLPIVLTENDTNLVKASQAVLMLPNPKEFRPYLYPVQGKHMIYAEFFSEIGVQEKPTVKQLCTVLQEIYTESINKTALQPNQQTTVQRVVQQLFSLIADEPEAAHFHKNTLYLPSTDGKLYESSTLFFNDTAFQAKRLEDSLKTKLKLLVKLNQCHLGNDHYEHQKLLQLLPEVIRPKLLSQVISESLVHAQVERCDYSRECEFSGWFEKHLSSQAFRHGLICLIRKQSKGTVSHTGAAKICDRIFGKIQIFCCKTLQTELLLRQESLKGTQTETQVYVERLESGCVFCLKHNDNMSHKVVNEVNTHLTREINGLLQNNLNLSSLPVLGQLLLCENMEDVERTLEQNCIRNSLSEEGFGVHQSPGSPIPEEWHDSLDMNPLNSFEKGEYVGFRKDESKNEYFFAIVVERLDELPEGIRLNPSRYKIQTGSDEFIEVSSLDLYQFKRETKAGTDEFTEESSSDVHQMFRRDARLASVTNGICTDIMPEPTRASQRRPIPQTSEEINREIDQSLKDVWNMSPEDKCKAIRRLYLRWHPDKNFNHQDLANKAFKYLQNKIDELERGRTTCNTSANSYNFRDYWFRWDDEARSHKRGREQFYRNNSRQHYNFWSYFRDTPKPNTEEAKRWYKQAQYDLSAAQSESAGEESPEWCLFKVHQAVEKALIATEYRKSGQHPGNCSITSLAQQVSRYSTNLMDLPIAVAWLSALGVDAKKT
ncbi:hypothetical protein NFI96_016782, partial [Prochilodus magdalenae]